MSNDDSNTASVHIVHCVYSFHVGGLEKIIANSIEGLPANYQHTIIALTTASPDFLSTISKPVNLIELHKPAGHSWSVFWQMYRQLRKQDADVFHSYNLAAIEYQVCAFFARISTRVHAEHGRDTVDPDGSNPKYKLLRRLCSPFIHYFVGVSEDLVQWLKTEVKLQPQKVKTILNGVDTSLFAPVLKDDTKSQLIKEHAQSSARVGLDTLVFGHVARLEPIKNQKLMIEAFAQACLQSALFLQSTKLLIIGDGSQRSMLEAIVADFSIPLPIEFSGMRYDMAQAYTELDVFVLSSDAEGIPMTMLEAMSTSLPVLSTQVGGIPEVVTQDCSYLTPAKDKQALSNGFLWFFEHQNDIPKMGACSRSIIVKDFSQINMLDNYVKLYEAR